MSWAKVLEDFPEANFLQSPEWRRVNEIIGKKTIVEEFEGRGYALMIVQNAKRGRYLEIPCGPLIDWKNPEILRDAFTKIRKIAVQNHCVFVRLRPQLRRTAENLEILSKLNLKPSPMHLAAEHTVIIDLTKTVTTSVVAKNLASLSKNLLPAKPSSNSITSKTKPQSANTLFRQTFQPC